MFQSCFLFYFYYYEFNELVMRDIAKKNVSVEHIGFESFIDYNINTHLSETKVFDFKLSLRLKFFTDYSIS